MPLPDFIIGGAPKSGTTALFNYVDQHPEVHTSTPKEPNFFANYHETRSWGRSYTLDEYKRLFVPEDPGQVAGEGSTCYLNHAEHVSPLMAEIVPDVQLLFLLRNPIDRAYSDYWYHLSRGNLPSRRPFSWYTHDPDHWIFDGSTSYVSGLKRFYDHFDRSQILVLLTDDLKRSRRDVFERACRHIGVDPGVEIDLSVRHNVTRYPRSPRLLRAVGRLAPGLSRWASGVPVLRPLRSRLLFSAQAPKPPMRPADRDRLAERYADAIDELSRLIDRDLSFWLDSSP
jgi:hypothetical protein